MTEDALSEVLPETSCQTEVTIDRWRRGESEAFDLLHARFAPLVERRILRHGSWRPLAGRMQLEDVTQEVWARLLRAAPAGFESRGVGSFAAFLGALTDRTVIDLARACCAAKRGGRAVDEALATGWEGRCEAGSRAVETPSSHARCSELEELAARELSDREFEAWELIELRGYLSEEAGMAMDCSSSAVRGLLARARARLVMALQRQERG